MIYYFNCACIADGKIAHRGPIFFEPALHRVLFIAQALKKKVCLVSMGNASKKGVWRSTIERVDKKIYFYYLRNFNILGLKYFFLSLDFLFFIIRKVRKDDVIILYNALPFYAFSVFLLKKIFHYSVVLDLEELHSCHISNKVKKNIFLLTESIALSCSDKALIANKNLKDHLKRDMPSLVSCGYSTLGESKNNFEEEFNAYRKVKTVVYAGRLGDLGGIKIFLDSLKYIQKPCIVKVSGAGPLVEYAKNWNPQNKCVEYVFEGFLSRKNFENMMATADLCVNPIPLESTFSQLSFPSKITQYLEFGNCVVSSSFQGLEGFDPALLQFINTYDRDDPALLAREINAMLGTVFRKKDVVSYFNQWAIKEQEKIKTFVSHFARNPALSQ